MWWKCHIIGTLVKAVFNWVKAYWAVRFKKLVLQLPTQLALKSEVFRILALNQPFSRQPFWHQVFLLMALFADGAKVVFSINFSGSAILSHVWLNLQEKLANLMNTWMLQIDFNSSQFLTLLILFCAIPMLLFDTL